MKNLVAGIILSMAGVLMAQARTSVITTAPA